MKRKNIETNRQVFWCSCGGHMISVERERFDSTIETSIQLWQAQGMLDKQNLRKRIGTAWSALRGKLYHDSVMLSEKEVGKLITALKAKV